MKKRLLTIILASAMVLGITACGGASDGQIKETSGADTGETDQDKTLKEASGETKVLKLASDQGVDYPTMVALQSFADEVNEKTDGRITITLYPSAQLGDENAYLQQLQFGAVDFAKSSVASLAQFCDDLNVLSLPYLFDSTDHMFKCLDGELGEELFTSLESANIVGLGFANNGSRCFFTKNQVKTADDLKNMKLRVQSSPLMLGLVECLGGFPQAIASTEVYSALQTGTVDGAENNINIYANESYYEQAPYFIKDNHNIQPEIIVVSKQTWDGLSGEDQAIIREAIDNAMEYQKELWMEREHESEEKLLEAGVTIYEPTTEELEKFREKCQPIYEDAELGKPYEEFVSKVRAIK